MSPKSCRPRRHVAPRLMIFPLQVPEGYHLVHVLNLHDPVVDHALLDWCRSTLPLIILPLAGPSWGPHGALLGYEFGIVWLPLNGVSSPVCLACPLTHVPCREAGSLLRDVMVLPPAPCSLSCSPALLPLLATPHSSCSPPAPLLPHSTTRHHTAWYRTTSHMAISSLPEL